MSIHRVERRAFFMVRMLMVVAGITGVLTTVG